jgi:hypothetical protein
MWGWLGCYQLDVRLDCTRAVDLVRVEGFQRQCLALRVEVCCMFYAERGGGPAGEA